MANPLYDSLFTPHIGSNAVFIFDPIENVRVTYAEFIEQTAQVANSLTALGLVPGDRLAAQIGKSQAALALYAACVQAGIVFLPLNTAYTETEVEYFVKDSGARVLVCDPAAHSALSPIAQQHAVTLVTQSKDGLSGSLPEASHTADKTFATANRRSDDLAAFLYTSGTTGRSKGAMLTQDNLLSNAITLVSGWEFTDKDKLLHALPVFHTHGLFVATNIVLLAGASMIFETRFDLDRTIPRLPFATSMMGVPTFYTRLLSDERFNKELVKSMRVFISGSAPLLAETHIKFEQVTGHRILERYGMTETNMNTSNPYHGERRAGTVGMPLDGVELKITDATTGEELPAGEIGVIEVRGPNVFKGYWNMPEKTKEELREDGFFITGDLGILDKDGYVSIVGRNKDLIISGGFNIYPKEIEQVLDEQPGVVESAVIGVPHKDFGETVVGVLVSEDGKLDTDAIQSQVESLLARFKHPRKLILVDELPRNTMGKVQKNVLREQYNDLFAE